MSCAQQRLGLQYGGVERHCTALKGKELLRIRKHAQDFCLIAGKPKKTMKRMMSMGGTPSVSTLASWQATIDDLVKAPSARLIPFVKVCHSWQVALDLYQRVCDGRNTRVGADT